MDNITFRLITLLTVALSAMTMKGQITVQQESQDSTLNVVAFFCKNDTVDYRYEHIKAKITGNDTVVSQHFVSDIRLVVRDSTSEGYEIESIPMGAVMDFGEDTLMTKIMQTMYEKMGDMRTVFTVDEYGELQHIKNWKEIKDFSRTMVKYVCDSLYSAMPTLNEVMPRARLEMIFTMPFLNEKTYMKEDDELQLLFGNFGNAFTIGRREIDTQDETGYPAHMEYEVDYGLSSDDGGYEGDYFISSLTTTTIPKEDIKSYANSVVGLFLSDKIVDNVAQEIEKMEVGDAEVKVAENYVYFFNGWPCEMTYYKTANVMNVKNIEVKNITWTSRAWHIFDFSDDDDTGVGM